MDPRDARRVLLARRAAVVAVALPALLVLVLGWHERWTADDAFIDFRVVHNVLAGHGPVFNVGDRVEAYTSPLWVGLLSLLTFVTRAPVEWVAVVLGLLLTAAGFACAGRAGVLLAQRSSRDATVLVAPFGLLALAALKPVWDFATSGLESGAEFAWLGASFLLLTRVAVREEAGAPPRLRMWPVALLLGVGPLLRPEFALFGLVWTAVLLLLVRRGWRRGLLTAAVALAPAVAYEVFRMGYFAATLPNTALAKEPGTARWGEGWAYLTDTFRPYLLVIPVVVLLGWWAQRVWRGAAPRRATVLSAATLGVAVLYGVYVVRLGGDFMHARMLLPVLFALVLPVAVIPLTARRDMLPFGAVALWALVCAASLRVPFVIGPDHPVIDERAFWATVARNPNPVTLQEHYGNGQTPVAVGNYLSQFAATDRAVILWTGDPTGKPGVPVGTPAAWVRQPVVATVITIGQEGVAAGEDVVVVDRLGLADEIAARIALDPTRRVGHQKVLPDAWTLARYADPSSLIGIDAATLSQVDAARAALTCDGPLRDLLTATTAPLTPGRFLGNLVHAWSYTTLRFPADPAQAKATLCG